MNPMEYSGILQGEAARLYAGYTYRKPVMARVDAWQLDPERLHPAHEYPRSVNPPSLPNTQAVELADYVVRVSASGNYGMSAVQVWMQPNEYTAARKPLMVCEFKARNAGSTVAEAGHLAKWLWQLARYRGADMACSIKR